MSRALVIASLLGVLAAPARADAPLDAVTSHLTGVTAPKTDPFEIPEEGRLEINVGHHFALAQVVERVGFLLAYWKKRFDIASEWRGNRVFLSGKVYGIKVEAVFEVSATAVSGFAKDPGWPWRGQISAYVDAKLKKYLHPTYDEP